jgi:hypothetical protein
MQRLIYGEILSDDFYSFTYKSKERVDDLTRSFDLSFVICHLSFVIQYGWVKAKAICQSQFFNEPHTPSGKQATRSVSSEKDAKRRKKCLTELYFFIIKN